MGEVVVIKVEGMGCGSCVTAVENAVRRVAPSAGIDVDLAGGTVSVRDAGVARERIEAAITAAGYDVAA